jgi:short-subunit dehydrogenase
MIRTGRVGRWWPELMDKRTALVTGASSGIGYELTKLLAADGYSLLLVARGEDRLAAVVDEMSTVHGVSAHVYPADLSLPGAAEALVETVGRDGHDVDVLVNNAGFTSFGKFHEIDPARHVDMLELNVVALTHLTRLLLPDMISRRSGRRFSLAH